MNQKYLKFPSESIAKSFEFLPVNFRDCFWESIELESKEFIKFALETTLDYEADLAIGASKYARNEERCGYRNGYRRRKTIYTSVVGGIDEFKFPKVKGTVFKSKILQPHKRRTTKFDYSILNLYVKGSTCRRIRDSYKRIFGTQFSHNMVSEILQKLQEKLDSWRKRRIDKEYYGLVIDGVWLHLKTTPKFIREMGKKTTKGVILTAMGIRENGEKEILGFKLCYSESEANWAGLLQDLCDRGFSLAADGLIVHDEAEGIKSSIDLVFPYHKKQSCIFHFIAGTTEHVKHKRTAKQIKTEISEVYEHSSNQKQAMKNMKRVMQKWRYSEPKLIRYIQKRFLATLTYYEFPKHWHNTFKTTNYLERTFREINRKLDDVGIFPNFYSAERIVFLEILELNYKETGEKPFYA